MFSVFKGSVACAKGMKGMFVMGMRLGRMGAMMARSLSGNAAGGVGNEGRGLGEGEGEGEGGGEVKNKVARDARFEDVLDYWVSLSPEKKEELVKEASEMIKNPPSGEMATKINVVYDDIHRLWGINVKAAMGAASLFSRFM